MLRDDWVGVWHTYWWDSPWCVVYNICLLPDLYWSCPQYRRRTPRSCRTGGLVDALCQTGRCTRDHSGRSHRWNMETKLNLYYQLSWEIIPTFLYSLISMAKSQYLESNWINQYNRLSIPWTQCKIRVAIFSGNIPHIPHKMMEQIKSGKNTTLGGFLSKSLYGTYFFT